DFHVTGVQTCALPISGFARPAREHHRAVENRALLSDELLAILGSDRLLAVDARLQPEACPLRRVRDDCLEVLPRLHDQGFLALRSEERRVGKWWRSGW